MPAFTDHYKHSRQQRDSSSSSLSSTPAPVTGGVTAGIAGAAGGAFVSSRPRIYPREYSNRNPKSPHLSTTTSPLLSALPNPSDIFARSIPFPSFLSSSSPSSGAPNSLGSASGGVGLSSGTSPPPSAPASYSSGGGFSAPRQARGYPGFEQQYSSYDGSGGTGGYYNPTQRYPHGSPQPVNGHVGGGPQPQLHPGDGTFACELATLDEPGITGGSARVPAAGGAGGENVVCLGWDGGLDVWRIGRGVVEQVGRLEGLKGSVKSAKILPNPPLNDPLAAHRPLVCLTLHAPLVHDVDPPPIMLEAESPYSTSPPSRPDSASDRGLRHADVASEWQTTVEVWSLSSKTRLATLFTSPAIPPSDAGFGISAPPPIWGGLRVQVSGSTIVVGVGDSGELYIFGLESASSKKKSQRETAEWKCIDKVWTALQYPANPNGSFSSEGGGANGGFLDPKLSGLGNMSNATAIFSLSDRWLAYCPASTGSFSAGGEVGVPFTNPSVTSQSPPAQPSISAAVSLEDEAFINRFTREVAQEVIRGARWAADTGYKKFQSYWNGGQSGSPPAVNPYPAPNGPMGMPQPVQAQPSGLGQQLRQMQQNGGQYPQFYAGQQANEPRLVSLMDLSKRTDGQHHMTPIATFLPPAGVSYLSFAPGGLALLTASSKGDLLFVWDLLKVVHYPPGNGSLGHQRTSSLAGTQDAKGSAGSSGNAEDTLGKHVRQIARFTRVTVATIVDVDWSSPRGEKLAVVTERGTAHFYDLPSGALQWPPPPRPPPSSAAVNNSQTTARDAAVSKAVNLFNSSTQPLLTAARRRRSRSSSVGSPNGGMFASPASARRNAGAVSTSGASSSPNDPQTGGNKIPLPPSSSGVTAGCIRFLAGKERGYVAVLGGGLLRIYELRPGGSGKKGSKIGGVANGNWWEYDLPLLPAAPEHPTDTSEGKASGFWTIRGHGSRSEEDDKGSKEPLACAEIETNSVFTPWHQEKRVKVFVYTPTEGIPVATPEFHEALTIPESYHAPPAQSDMLSPNPLSWQVDEPPVPERRGRKKGKKGSRAPPPPSESPSPPLLDFSDVSPSPSPQPPPQRATARTVERVVSTPTKQQEWVFGLSLEAERIFLSDAGGRGDVEFSGEGQDALAKAMADGLSLAEVEQIRADRSRAGFFEEDAEVLGLTEF